MSQNTNIEWTDATWNPTEGCSMAKGSENGGCLNCYAARTALRRPAAGLAVMRDTGPRWTGKVHLVESRLDAPLHWRAPKRIFVNSMSDLFHEELTDETINRVFAVMALCPRHTFQVLTKRPERMLRYCGKSGHRYFMDYLGVMCHQVGILPPDRKISWPLPNVWLGVSVENFATWDARVHILKDTPAAKRFVSYEPALEDLGCVHIDGIDWLIIGGESGPGARPFDIQWARNTIEQCRSVRVACFVKQLGAFPVSDFTFRDFPSVRIDNNRPRYVRLKNRKGGDMSEWPKDIRVREFPL